MPPEIENFNGLIQTLIPISVLSSIAKPIRHIIVNMKWIITTQYNIGLDFFTVLRT
jgi:hypothetical protein